MEEIKKDVHVKRENLMEATTSNRCQLDSISSFRAANYAFQAWKREIAQSERRSHADTKAKLEQTKQFADWAETRVRRLEKQRSLKLPTVSEAEHSSSQSDDAPAPPPLPSLPPVAELLGATLSLRDGTTFVFDASASAFVLAATVHSIEPSPPPSPIACQPPSPTPAAEAADDVAAETENENSASPEKTEKPRNRRWAWRGVWGVVTSAALVATVAVVANRRGLIGRR